MNVRPEKIVQVDSGNEYLLPYARTLLKNLWTRHDMRINVPVRGEGEPINAPFKHVSGGPKGEVIEVSILGGIGRISIRGGGVGTVFGYGVHESKDGDASSFGVRIADINGNKVRALPVLNAQLPVVPSPQIWGVAKDRKTVLVLDMGWPRNSTAKAVRIRDGAALPLTFWTSAGGTYATTGAVPGAPSQEFQGPIGTNSDFSRFVFVGATNLVPDQVYFDVEDDGGAQRYLVPDPPGSSTDAQRVGPQGISPNAKYAAFLMRGRVETSGGFPNTFVNDVDTWSLCTLNLDTGVATFAQVAQLTTFIQSGPGGFTTINGESPSIATSLPVVSDDGIVWLPIALDFFNGTGLSARGVRIYRNGVVVFEQQLEEGYSVSSGVPPISSMTTALSFQPAPNRQCSTNVSFDGLMYCYAFPVTDSTTRKSIRVIVRAGGAVFTQTVTLTAPAAGSGAVSMDDMIAHPQASVGQVCVVSHDRPSEINEDFPVGGQGGQWFMTVIDGSNIVRQTNVILPLNGSVPRWRRNYDEADAIGFIVEGFFSDSAFIYKLVEVVQDGGETTFDMQLVRSTKAGAIKKFYLPWPGNTALPSGGTIPRPFGILAQRVAA